MKFLNEIAERFKAQGHVPYPWTKGRWGFHTHCGQCGAMVSVTVYKKEVREFPKDTCAERQASVTAYHKEWLKNDRVKRSIK